MFQIAHRLMGKILIDLRNTKEETLSVAELKKSDEENDDGAATMLRSLKKLDGSKDSPRVGSRRQQSAAENVTDDDTEKETQYRLDPKYVVLNLRSQLYIHESSKGSCGFQDIVYLKETLHDYCLKSSHPHVPIDICRTCGNCGKFHKNITTG
jgi:hypothetical protein